MFSSLMFFCLILLSHVNGKSNASNASNASNVSNGCILNKRHNNLYLTQYSCVPFESDNVILPESVDWRECCAVTNVKNQERCGSCWAFSSTGAMEGAMFIGSGKLISLSEQELVDCVKKDHGCNGGSMDDAFEYAQSTGICTEDEDPYVAEDEKCKICDDPIKFSSCVLIDSNNQLHLKEAVSKQPVSVAIQANTNVFQSYTGGIINDSSCGTELDHGVLIVGYGEEKGEKYWIVKNSWGMNWGEDGYVRIARSDSTNDPGICGIAMQASYPVY